MPREPVARLIEKTSHWPAKKRRQHLIQALQLEKGRHRRKKISDALCGITTRVLRDELAKRRKQ